MTNTAMSENNEEMASLIRSVLKEQHAEADQDWRSEVSMLREQLAEQHAELEEQHDLRSEVSVLREQLAEQHAELEEQHNLRSEVSVLREQLAEQHAELEEQHGKKVDELRNQQAEADGKVAKLERQVESLTRMLGLTSLGSGAAPALHQEEGEAQASAVAPAVPRPGLHDSNGGDGNFNEFLPVLSMPQTPPETRRGDVESQEPGDNHRQTNEAYRSHEDSPLFTEPEERRREGGLSLEAHAGRGGGVTASLGGEVEGFGVNQLQGMSSPFSTTDNALGEVQPQGLGVFSGAGGSDRVNAAPGGLVARTASTSNQTTPVQGTVNSALDENDRKARFGFSLYERDTGTHYPFQASAIFFFITSSLWSAEFMLAAMAVGVAVGIMVLAIIDAFEDGEEGNLLNIPAGVRAPVRAAQVFAAIVGVLSEQESYQGVALLKFAIKKTLHLTGDRERIQVKRWKVFFASFCFLTVGSLFQINIVLSIIRADEVISLFFDILALEFVLNLDNLIYEVCKYFSLVKDATRKVKKLELDRPAITTQSSRNWRLPFTTRAFFVKVLAVVISLSVLFTLQQTGTYTPNSIAVTFGDETWEQARVRDEDETRVLLYSYFSGVYKRDCNRNGYARYVEQNKENGRPFNDAVPAEIVYCPNMKSWVFTHPHIYKSVDEDKENCNWLMRSSKTDSFDIVEAAGDNWETWVGTIKTSTSLSIYSNECLSDEDCNFNGKCEENECICNTNEDGTSLFFGRQCQLEMPCGILVTENVELGSRTQLLMVESDDTNEGFLKSYGRPIYTVTGLSGVPEALLSVNPKSYGHAADRSALEVVIDSGNKAFEDDDFFRESLKEFDENPLGDTLFDFGGTEISLRNYAVILAFSGSRWFATIDRPDFNVKDFYNADYHAFWQNTYSDRTFLVSDTTSNGSPVGVEFFSPRRRKTGKDYGPFGILLPNSEIEGVGFFQCYANVGRCTFVDINVSTQNKSLPTNQGDYFSGDQIVSWKLESVEEGSNKIEQESPSVLLGAQFSHRYCLADGAYTFAMADNVCKSSWWECQHGRGKTGYNISINDVPVWEECGTFQESKFSFAVLQAVQELQENRNSTYCSGRTNFNVTVYTDGSPYETSWHLSNDAYEAPLLKGGPYPFYNSFASYDHIACLADGDYNFTIFDSGGDGMIPPGHYDIMVGDETVVRGGHLFENSRSTPFSIVGGSLSLASRTYSTTPTPTKHYCSEVLFDVLGSSTSNSLSQSQNEIFWSVFDIAQQAHVVQAQPLNRNDPKAACLYKGVYTFTYEHSDSECFGNGLSLFNSGSSLLYDGPICRNTTFSFLMNNMASKSDEGGKETSTQSSLEKGCMNNFHLTISVDITKGMSDNAWELIGRNGMNLKGDQFGDSSETYYSHHACLKLGTYHFTTWKHPASQYTLSYRKSTLSSNVELDFDQLVPVGNRPVAVNSSDLSFSWTDVGNTIMGKSSNSDGGGWIVKGSGAGIGEKNDPMGNSDSFHYLYESFSEDMGMAILVESLSANSSTHSMGGIMFRDSLHAGSRHYSMLFTSQNELRTLYRRTCTGCETIHAHDGTSVDPNSVWLRVTKEGDWFTSYYKEGDSQEWNQLGPAELVRFSSEEFFVGIAVTSHDETTMATLEASNVELVALREAHEYGLTLWEERKILPRDGMVGGWFGSAVALDGSTLVIGAERDNVLRGSAYVFVRDDEGWKEEVKFNGTEGEQEGFGSAVAVHGNTILIGAWTSSANGPGSGIAYVFVRDGADWREQAKLVPHDGVPGGFGRAVALDGKTTVISSHFSRSAYVFVQNGEVWTEQAKLVPDSAHSFGFVFGKSVAVSKDTILIGAVGNHVNVTSSGIGHVFVRSGEVWKEQAKLVPRDGVADTRFGWSVALSGDIAVIGAPGENCGYSGSAHVFVRHGEVWSEHAKLLRRNGAECDEFGYSVALSENIIVIGARHSDESGDESGSTHVFARRGQEWREVDKLLPHDSALGDNFGWAVALDNDTLAITSPLNNDNGPLSGSAHTFTTPTLELIRAGTLPPPSALSSSSTASLASSFLTASCVDVDFGVNVSTGADPDSYSWALSRIFNKGDRTAQATFLRGSSFVERHTERNYADVMCLERGSYQFVWKSKYEIQGDYTVTVDGNVITSGARFADKETIPFTIPFVLSPSSLPSLSLSPSQTPSTSSVPSVSSGPSLLPSASSRPTTSPRPTSSWPPSTPPSVSTSPTSCFGVEINVFTDWFPWATTWRLSQIITADGTSFALVVLEGSPRKAESHHTDAACLKRGEYEFDIISPGYYNLTVGGEVIAQGGNFEDEETVNFTIPFVPSPPPSVYPSSSPSSSSHPSRSLSPSSTQVPSASPSLSLSPSSSQVPSMSPSTSLYPTCSFVIVINILTDAYPEENSWTLWRATTLNGISSAETLNGISSAEVVLEGSPESAATYHTHTACLERGNYVFTIYDSWGDGICCDSGEGHYNITVDGKVIARGGEFERHEEVSFSIEHDDGNYNIAVDGKEEETVSFSTPFIRDENMPSKDTPAPEAGTRPTYFPTHIVSPSSISSEILRRQPSVSPATSAAPSTPSPSDLCQEVEVGMSFDGLPAGLGWAIMPLETGDGAGSDDVAIPSHSFFPSSASPGGDVRSLCLGEGRYKFVAYDYVSDGGVVEYYIESNGEMIWQGGEFELTETVVFDIPYVP